MTFKSKLNFWLLLGIFCFGAPVAQAAVYYDIRTLLSEQFRFSERVTYRKLALTKDERALLAQRVGRSALRNEYTLFVALSKGQIDGYAIVDEERGQHEMITFAAFFDREGRVMRHEVLAYREPFGDGIRQQRFRNQFVGRDAKSGFALGKDIDSVSGATISAQSMCVGIKRATLVVDVLRKRIQMQHSVASL